MHTRCGFDFLQHGLCIHEYAQIFQIAASECIFADMVLTSKSSVKPHSVLSANMFIATLFKLLKLSGISPSHCIILGVDVYA